MAFIKGRQITDGPLLVNEIISWAKKHKKKLLLLKVDFEKAFDCLSWSFLDSIMMQMGFCNTWRKWIHSCLSSAFSSVAFSSVLVNGSPTKEFKIEKGLRQGDPLSPFLFILVVEALNVVFLEARYKNIFHGVDVSHLQFADDALIIGQWSLTNIKNLSRILTCFHIASGLKVNFNKSNLFGIGVPTNDVNSMAHSIGCLPSQLPCIYLGLPIGANMTRCSNWTPLVERFQKHLSMWKCKALSYGGRLTLIKFVLEERKIAWIAWDKVISPLNQGGLGIGSLKISNQSLLAKWWWRFLNEENALWRKVIFCFDLPSVFRRKVENDQTTKFWIDSWLGGAPLCSTFPRLFRLESLKSCLVCERAPMDTATRGNSSNEQPHPLGLLFPWAWNDSWECTIDDNRLFTVKGMRKHITNLSHTSVAQPFRWNKALPIKINVFSCRQDPTLTKETLT
ncbi:putative RNA-directed DNA polymerase, eukaryota, reverse transcriptase zinc-binding domain protein [Tanacetum coccineum]